MNDSLRAVFANPHVPKNVLIGVPIFTWLEMKDPEMGPDATRMVLLYDKISKGDVTVPVVDVQSGEGIWCEFDQIVSIGERLAVPKVPRKHSAKPVLKVVKGGKIAKPVKSVEPIKSDGKFPFQETDFGANVAEIQKNSRLYTDRQISFVINKMVKHIVAVKTKGAVLVKEDPGSIKRTPEFEGVHITFYLTAGEGVAADDIGGMAEKAAAGDLLSLMRPIGLYSVISKKKSITLMWAPK